MIEMQKQFEDWMKEYWFDPNLTQDQYGYENETVRQQWAAWRASRAEITVTLPKVYDDNFGGHMSALSVEIMLDDAGISYKKVGE